jgi:hypothetical protein
MKLYSTFALTALAAISLATVRAVAHDVENPIYFKGTLQISEITAVKNGVSTTYDVPAALASQWSMSSIGTSMGFGFSSRCAPYLGETPTELRHKVTNLTAFKSIKVSDFKYEKEPVDVPDSITVVIPKGSRVEGTCGADGKTLTELTIRSPENARIVFDEKN